MNERGRTFLFFFFFFPYFAPIFRSSSVTIAVFGFRITQLLFFFISKDTPYYTSKRAYQQLVYPLTISTHARCMDGVLISYQQIPPNFRYAENNFH